MNETSLNETSRPTSSKEMDQEFSRIELGARVFSWITVTLFGFCFIALLLIHWHNIPNLGKKKRSLSSLQSMKKQPCLKESHSPDV
ncbi:DnaJ protein [Trichuris trichiura]|uniref:DnaJ protein n=1 Tax=Trichuris trichiura TaxID=36087 RepID=A0A077Z869_TRITR|nr:DnaJ protein [Trichuris trichiura]